MRGTNGRESAPKRYFSGEPCKHGHFAERYIKSGQCVVCSATVSAARYHGDVEWHRRHIQTIRGLPQPLRPRPELCECCGSRQRKGKVLALDHDHETKKFRGWLCDNCNTSIGKLGDNIAGVQRALAYLRRAE